MKNRIKVKQGLYWHVHHSQTVEFCYDYAERKDYIREEKPLVERSLRLKLFKPVTTLGASAKLKKFIEGCRTINVNDGYSQAMHDLAKSLGWKNNAAALAAVMKLHKRQCHPRCPVTKMFSNILKHVDSKGNYTLKPLTGKLSHALQGK